VARGRAQWKRFVDPKTYLTRAMVGLERAAPAVTGAIGYYSILEPPSRFESVREERVPSRLREAPYAEAFATLSTANVDTPTGQIGHPGHADAAPGGVSLGPLPALETRRFCAVLDDVLVPGHTLLPAHAATGRLLSAYGGGVMNWGHAYPAPVALRRVAVPGLAWAVAPVRNYFHLLIEHVLPAIDELVRRRDLYRGTPITVVASRHGAVLRSLLDLLAPLGLRVEILEASRFSTYRPERYLFAKPISATVEHFYGYAETVETLKDLIRRRDGAPSGPARLYIPRTGTRIRRLETEPALVEALAARGFETFTASWSNFDRQIATFMAAREIVSVHGAALTNIVWAGRDARTVEIFPVNARKTTYLHMASQHDQSYAAGIGGPEDERQNFSVPVEAVTGLLA
jgi:hypothetical protein